LKKQIQLKHHFIYFTAKKLIIFVSALCVLLNVMQDSDLVKMASAIGNSITFYRKDCSVTIREDSVYNEIQCIIFPHLVNVNLVNNSQPSSLIPWFTVNIVERTDIVFSLPEIFPTQPLCSFHVINCFRN
jgi:hypothetical protein